MKEWEQFATVVSVESSFVEIEINIACFRFVSVDYMWHLAAACETVVHLDGAFGSETDHDVSEQRGI